MNLVKLTDNTSLVISKIEEQTPLKVSLEKKISKKQEDINALLQFMKTKNTSHKVMEAVIEERNEMRTDNVNIKTKKASKKNFD